MKRGSKNYDSIIQGGWILHDYLDVENEQSRKLDRLAREEKFDLCVLQEQSTTPLMDYPAFLDGIVRIMDKLRDAATGFLLYETWGRGAGHPHLAELSMSSDAMSAAVADAYVRAGQAVGVEVSHAGSNFARVYLERPDISVFNPDLLHASYEGSCLIALTHYKTIFHELPENTAALKLPQETIQYFLQVVGENNMN